MFKIACAAGTLALLLGSSPMPAREADKPGVSSGLVQDSAIQELQEDFLQLLRKE